jgi:hypothetical protein
VIDVAPGASPVCPACGFGSGSGSAPSPAVSGPTSPPVQPMMSAPAGFAAPPPMGMSPAQQRTSGKAIAALVLGIVSMCVPYVGLVTGIIAIIFGVLGMKEVDRDPQNVKGKGMAIAGLVLGAVALLLYLIVILFFGAFLMSFGECIQDPDAPGCEEFQEQSFPEPDAAWLAPKVARPAWTEVVGVAWMPLRSLAS